MNATFKSSIKYDSYGLQKDRKEMANEMVEEKDF